MFGYTVKKADKFVANYSVENRGSYWVVKREYRNGNVKTDRLGSRRGNSTIRTVVNGRAFG